MKNLFILLFILSLLSCGEKKTASIATDENTTVVSIADSSLVLMDVQLTAPEIKQVESNIYLAGKVMAIPNFRASVSTDISGKIDNIMVREGTYVKKGMPLMSLRSMEVIELQNQFFEARAQRDFLQLEFKRQEELIKNNIGALVDFQTTESKLRAAESKVNALQAKLMLLGYSKEFINNPEVASNVMILAPIDGYVFKLPVQIGMLATTDVTLAEIVNNRELMADVFVYDKDLDNITEGQPVEIDFITHSYPSVIGSVAHISRAIDPQTKAVTVHVKFTAPADKLVLPDMSVRCVIVKKESLTPKLTVPLAAILTEEDHHFVYLSFTNENKNKETMMHKYRVSLGNQNEKQVQIAFANEPTGDYRIVTKNLMIVENERKKKSGMTFE
ncbi:MAG: efflux RND transporter periplasmic adaptor subunit [Chryseotalea sp. WA131a]|nr:MAG: efflux RND transporter periplasmic adaptor subunit [Chryseotalea sp. WA131a]